MRREKPIDELEQSLRRIHFHTPHDERKQIRDTRRQQENKRQRREDQVERNSAGEEQDVVFTAVVPDALDVVAERPAKVEKKGTLGR